MAAVMAVISQYINPLDLLCAVVCTYVLEDQCCSSILAML